jgi:hypothetical protein
MRLNKIRAIVGKFSSDEFTTQDVFTHYRSSFMSDDLKLLVDMGEIQYVGTQKTGGAPRKIWRRTSKLKRVESGDDVVYHTQADKLHGWREVTPELFRDPQIPGRKRVENMMAM